MKITRKYCKFYAVRYFNGHNYYFSLVAIVVVMLNIRH